MLKKKEIIMVANYVREIIEKANQNEVTAYNLTAERIGEELVKKFKDFFPSGKIDKTNVSKYVKKAGYKYDGTKCRYELAKQAFIDDKKLKCYDQPFVTVIKTALEDTDNIKDCLYGNFKEDIIFIKEETTEDAGILIIYSTKYNLGSAFNALVEESTEEYYGTEKEED